MPARRWRPTIGLAIFIIGSAFGRPTHAQVPAAISDAEFWRLITTLSEDAGAFPQQLMSNEDSAQFVIPTLTKTVPSGGIYIGVGSEQNFTYLAALKPRLSFIVDIRRENTLEMLLYKALFELSADRVEFIARLFGRPAPASLDRSSPVTALFAAFESAGVDQTFADRAGRDVIEYLTRAHALPLTDADCASIIGMLSAFQAAGPHGLKGYGDRTNPPYATLLSLADLDGRQHSFLASAEAFAVVKDLQRRNLIIPITGDFAGTRTLAGIGRYLRERYAAVDVFYVSNVERYLLERPEHGRPFYANVAALPLASSSVFVRSVTRDISQRLGIALPSDAWKWWTFLFSIRECLADVAAGKIQSYRDLFAHPQQ